MKNFMSISRQIVPNMKDRNEINFISSQIHKEFQESGIHVRDWKTLPKARCMCNKCIKSAFWLNVNESGNIWLQCSINLISCFQTVMMKDFQCFNYLLVLLWVVELRYVGSEENKNQYNEVSETKNINKIGLNCQKCIYIVYIVL